ncbi:hypothetical protein OKW24_000626 [Peribacillus simplex]|uniref:hypothetical protein n=1 Tax=Peribacillus simplex TaxID=1478 RepID=UPI0024E2557A|nr:hypothetical protein [Peribacillus simplex]MDF9758853.1 hypothetical protein [Peribacillus simplex]
MNGRDSRKNTMIGGSRTIFFCRTAKSKHAETIKTVERPSSDEGFLFLKEDIKD